MDQLIFNLRNPPTMSQFHTVGGLYKDMASQMNDAADIIEAQRQSLRAHVERRGQRLTAILMDKHNIEKGEPNGDFWID